MQHAEESARRDPGSDSRIEKHEENKIVPTGGVADGADAALVYVVEFR